MIDTALNLDASDDTNNDVLLLLNTGDNRLPMNDITDRPNAGAKSYIDIQDQLQASANNPKTTTHATRSDNQQPK
ncbi:unnamed protein product [Rotaria sp. Silwood1]|nr:unnamed protein product [Rotaria sp. Silwood1]